MRNTFVRTITTTKIYGSSISPDANGQLIEHKLEPIVANGDLSPERQQRELLKAYGDQFKNIIVTKAEKTSAKYAISIEDFIKYGSVVEDAKD